MSFKNYVLRINPKEFVFYFVVFDILFFPYIRVLSCLSSMLIVYIWTMTNFWKLKDKSSKVIGVILICLVVLSIGMSFLKDSRWFTSNVTNGILLCSYIVYYLFFQHSLIQKEYSISKIFEIYIWIVFCFGVLYLLNPQMYFEMRSFWTLSGNTIVFSDAFVNRFTFIQSDPNSIGCILCSMLLYIILFDEKKDQSRKLLLTIIVGIVCAISLSATSVVVFGLCIVGYWMFSLKGKFYVKVKTLVSGICLFGVLVIAGIVAVNIKFNVDLVDLVIRRIGGNIQGGTMSGRTEIWQSILVSFDWSEYILWGYGSSLVDNYGISRTPHNGHFFVILAYGFIAYLFFMYLFFRKRKSTTWKEYLLLIPLLLLFSVNTLLIDFRACLILPLIVALYDVEAPKRGRKNE